jgi:heat shock protein HspQ
MDTRLAKFMIGQVVRHRVYPFRGVIFDVDPVFANTEEYWLSIPEHIRPHKDQPFYHLLAENDESAYVAYVSEQNLLIDDTGQPVGHPQASLIFETFDEGQYRLRMNLPHRTTFAAKFERNFQTRRAMFTPWPTI